VTADEALADYAIAKLEYLAAVKKHREAQRVFDWWMVRLSEQKEMPCSYFAAVRTK
jgi:hypothetical protein